MRRLFVALCVAGLAFAGAPGKGSSSGPPRKVVVATAVRYFEGEYSGLDNRLDQLAAIVDEMAAQSRRKYHRGMDLVVLPETAVTAGPGRGGPEGALPFEGPVRDLFARKAREYHCYIVVPMVLVEGGTPKRYSNAGILLDRSGKVVGTYRKVHLAVATGSDSMEGGLAPGREVPVFECDFGKVGIQICFDMQFDYGWDELARAGAELVAWPTASPQTARPAARALEHRYYIVSSTPRDNASVFEPTGKIAAQVRPTPHSPLSERILVEELDLSYAILPWSQGLADGEALRKRYGSRIGFHYYREEDCGIFWSNDPSLAIGPMIRAAGFAEADDETARIRKLYHAAGVPAY